MPDLKTPPHSAEAERAVLGSILLDNASRGEDRIMDLCLSGGISPESFWEPRHRVIFDAMRRIGRSGRPLDALVLVEELRVSGRLEEIGGSAYIEALIDQTPTTAHAEHYIGIVRAKHLRRTMIDCATRVVANCYDEAQYPDPQVVLGEAEKSFLGVDAQPGGSVSWTTAVEDGFRRLNEMFSSNGRRLEGLSTGLVHLDEKLQGLKKGEMIVIAARPSVGKTSLAMNIAESAAVGEMQGLDTDTVAKPTPDGGKRHPVLIFSLEMPVEALVRRMVAGRARINTWRLNRNLCTKTEKQALMNNLAYAVDSLKDLPIYVDDSAGLDIMDLRARARRARKQHGIELIVIDYLQLCTCREGARQGSRQIEVGMISQQIKAMAKELRIPVIVLSQLSRANEQRGDKFEKPKLSDLRDSGAIEQDADVVFLLRRPSRTASDPESQDQKLAIVDVAKNRNGEIGEVRVDFVREFVRFFDRPLPASDPGENFRTSEPPPDAPSGFVADPML